MKYLVALIYYPISWVCYILAWIMSVMFILLCWINDNITEKLENKYNL